MFKASAAAALAALLFLGVAGIPVSRGADLPPVVKSDTLRSLLERDAEFYLLRASFDLFTTDEIPSLLAADARSLVEHPSTSTQTLAGINERLLAEGSYYVTNLYYLISIDGAVWPSDRPESDYKSESLKTLDQLRHTWIAAVGTTADLKPLLRELDTINAQTQGDTDLPPDLDHFANVDELVSAAISTVKSRA